MTKHIKLQLTCDLITCKLPACCGLIVGREQRNKKQMDAFLEGRDLWWGSPEGDRQSERDLTERHSMNEFPTLCSWNFLLTPLSALWSFHNSVLCVFVCFRPAWKTTHKNNHKESMGLRFNHPSGFFLVTWLKLTLSSTPPPIQGTWSHADSGLRAHQCTINAVKTKTNPLQLLSLSALSNVTSQQESWQT